MFRITIIALVLMGLVAQPVLGDVVFLRDGRQIEGRIVDITDDTLVVEPYASDHTDPLRTEVPRAEIAYAVYAVNEPALVGQVART